MKLRRLHDFWIMSLLLFGMLGVSCSSDQMQDQEDLETYQQQGSDGEEEDQQGDYEQQGEYEQGQVFQESYQGDYDQNPGGNEDLLGNNTDLENNLDSENDLANIIDEMNQMSPESEDSNQEADYSQATTETNGEEISENGEDAQLNELSPLNSETGGLIGGSAGPPAGPGLPEIGSKLSYIVVRGDTLGKIAKRIYGRSEMWQELASNSGFENPSRIYPGDIVYYQLTGESLAFATEYENISQEEITVQQGDTLGTIAHKAYGDSRLWKYIWRQNGQLTNPHRVEIGSKLYFKNFKAQERLTFSGSNEQRSQQIPTSAGRSNEKMVSSEGRHNDGNSKSALKGVVFSYEWHNDSSREKHLVKWKV